MPILPSTDDSGSEMVFRMIAYVLSPANGYEGSLVREQIRVGLVPKEVQDRYPVYGSIYDATPRIIDTHLSVMDPLMPQKTEELNSQRIQVSMWGATKAIANQAADEIRKLLREFPTPVLFPNVLVLSLEVTNLQVIQEEQHVWHSLFDVVLSLQT